MQHQKEMSLKERIVARLSAFLYNNRRLFLIIAVGLVLLIAGYAGWSAWQDHILKQSTLRLEAVETTYQNWQSADDEAKKTELRTELTASLEDILDRYPGTWAAQRALFMSGGLAFEGGEWEQAAGYYRRLFEAFPESYLAPVSLFNAAVAREEAGDREGAVAAYRALVDAFGPETPQVPHALFSIARLHETAGEYREAGDIYEQLVEEYTASSWTSLARNRIIYLESEGLLEKS